MDHLRLRAVGRGAAVKVDKDALRRLVGIDWDTVGRICDRVVADELDPGRLDDQFDIGLSMS